MRRRLPKKRPSQTVSFTVGGAEGYLTTGSYPDDGLGEVFIKLGKQGSTLAGVMDAFSIAVSVGLQYGIPLESYVAKFTNLRFEPAGMTDDPDVRIATAVMDYLFRRIALDYLPVGRAGRAGHLLRGGAGGPGVRELRQCRRGRTSAARLRSTSSTTAARRGHPPAAERRRTPAGPDGAAAPPSCWSCDLGKSADAPLCFTCGTKMRPSGACYVCEGCGSTSGCS